MMGDTFRNILRDALAHREEHRECEHLDGAVPFVRCVCGETFGYHVGHEGSWQTCEQGWCAPSGTIWRTVVEDVPDDVTGACSTCGEYLYGEDDTFGPYLSAGDAVFCYDCAGHATRGVR